MTTKRLPARSLGALATCLALTAWLPATAADLDLRKDQVSGLLGCTQEEGLGLVVEFLQIGDRDVIIGRSEFMRCSAALTKLRKRGFTVQFLTTTENPTTSVPDCLIWDLSGSQV